MNNQLSLFNNLNKKMSSLEIAELTQKRHDNVIRDIKTQEPAYLQVFVNELKFEVVKYKDKKGEQRWENLEKEVINNPRTLKKKYNYKALLTPPEKKALSILQENITAEQRQEIVKVIGCSYSLVTSVLTGHRKNHQVFFMALSMLNPPKRNKQKKGSKGSYPLYITRYINDNYGE